MLISPEALPRMTVEEYLDYEHSQEIRHELVDGYLYAMGGASEKHERIAGNLFAALSIHLRGSDCRAYKSNLKVAVGDDYYYPDIFVACGSSNGNNYVRTDPVVIVEVLSPTTQRHDRGDKRLVYETIDTLEQYVLVWQDTMRVEIRDTKLGVVTTYEAPSDELMLTRIDFSVDLARLYE